MQENKSNQAVREAGPDDASLVREAKAGSMDAFEQLVSRHERAVYALTWNLLRNEQDAEDATQQTFLSVVEHLDGFREEASFGTWIRQIAAHAALKIIRKRKGLDVTSLDAALEPEEGYEGMAHPEYIADWSQSPEQLARKNETIELINQAMQELDEKHRLVFLLRDVEGFSVRETAELLRISEANVKVRLLRARLDLREKLTAAFGDPGRRFAPHSHE